MNKAAGKCLVLLSMGAFALGPRSSPLEAGESYKSASRDCIQEQKSVRPDWDEVDREQDRRWDIDRVLDGLDIRSGQRAGDLGAGWGYLTFKLARRVAPDGKVYAEDIDARLLKTLEARASERGLTNIETILGGEYEPRFPAGQLDLIVMRAVVQFVEDRPRFLRAAGAGLKEGGRFVIIEGESGDSSADHGVIGPGRFPTREGYLEIFRRAGLVLVSAETIKTRETFQVGVDEMTVFVLKPASESQKAEGQKARIANSAKIEEGVRSGTFAFRLTEPKEIESLFGAPSNIREGKDGGYDLLFWEYPDLAVRFAKMRSSGAPFVLRDVSVKGKSIDIGQSRRLALRTADDLGKIDSFWGLAGVSLAKLDLRQHEKFVDTMSFDTRTEWPPADRLPEGFEPGRLLENAITPGLGVRALHEMGINGTGIGLAIVDQPLLLGHMEYTRRLVRYDAAGLAGMSPQMHASPVSSIAVGQTLGVAPAATLTFFAVPTWQRDNEPYIRSLKAILAFNGTLPSTEKIRVVSISTGMFPQQAHFEEWKAALEETETSGILVVTCDRNVFPYGILSLRPGADPDDRASYGRGRYSGDDDLIRVPGQNRTVASHLGVDVYTFDRTGGLSWGAPYIAGLAALAFQVYPEIRPGDIRKALVETAKKTDAGPIVDPAAFIERLRDRRKD